MILDDSGVDVPIFDAHPTLDLMNADAIAFYLTGSRFAGCARPDSDWDFFAADTPDVWAWAMREGFAQLCGDEKADGVRYDTAHPYTTGIVVKGDVQVQIVTDVDLARRTRDLVYGTFATFDREAHAAKDGTRGVFWAHAATLVALTLPKPAPTPESLVLTAPADALDLNELPF